MDVESKLGIPRPTCYCPHHSDGNEDCDRCLGCTASRAAVVAERERCASLAEEFAQFPIDQEKGPIQQESARLIAKEIREREVRPYTCHRCMGTKARHMALCNACFDKIFKGKRPKRIKKS